MEFAEHGAAAMAIESMRDTKIKVRGISVYCILVSLDLYNGASMYRGNHIAGNGRLYKHTCMHAPGYHRGIVGITYTTGPPGLIDFSHRFLQLSQEIVWVNTRRV